MQVEVRARVPLFGMRGSSPQAHDFIELSPRAWVSPYIYDIEGLLGEPLIFSIKNARRRGDQ